MAGRVADGAVMQGALADPLVRARTLVHELPLDEKREVLDAHPAIGQRKGLSRHSAAEQGADIDPAVLAELHRLNADYEARHGFRFVVFVDRRPKAEILEVLRERIDNPTELELETALDELVSFDLPNGLADLLYALARAETGGSTRSRTSSSCSRTTARGPTASS